MRRCVLCSTRLDPNGKTMRKETRFCCRLCDVALCIVPCFGLFHELPRCPKINPRTSLKERPLPKRLRRKARTEKEVLVVKEEIEIFQTLTRFPSEEDLQFLLSKCTNPSKFAVNIARTLFTKEEMRESNCRGVKDKFALDKQRLRLVREAVVKYFEIPPHFEGEVWKQCMQAIDTRCRHERRPKMSDFPEFRDEFR